MAPSEWLPVGRIVAAHGLKGWVRVQSLSDFPERLLDPGPRWLQRKGELTDQPLQMQLEHGQYYPNKNLYLVRFTEIADRTTAEAWVGASILVSRQDRPNLEEEEYYCPDLVGLDVFHQPTGQRLGQLTNVIPAGHDLLEVTTDAGEIMLIPFVNVMVPVVDLKQKRIEVIPPPGLLEIYIDWQHPSETPDM